MLIFWEQDTKKSAEEKSLIAVSAERIFQVVQEGSCVKIFYNGGDKIISPSGLIVDKATESKIKFATADEARQAMREYCAAYCKNLKMFYFGTRKEENQNAETT